jgi:hypothetical protein
LKVVKGHPAAAAPWGNPCLYLSPNLDGGTGAPRPKALFENQQVRFILTNLDAYVGDAADINFTVMGGFGPLRVTSLAGEVSFSLGVRILTGPMLAPSPPSSAELDSNPGSPYMFLIDQGRTSTFLSRGQVLRFNPRPSLLLPGGQFESSAVNSTFPIQ